MIIQNQTKLVNEENRIMRECRGRRLCISQSVFMIQNSNHGYYVKSESSNDRYYFVEYKENSNFCTCWDYASNRSDKCKHIFAVQYALHLGLVQQIDHKLPLTHKKAITVSSSIEDNIKPKSIAEQYKDLSIATLNELEKAEIEEAERYNHSKTQRQHNWEDDEYTF